MAAVMGKDGDVRIGSVTLSLDSWTYNPSFGTADITKFGNTTKVNAQTIQDYTIEASGTLDMADAQQGALLDQFKAGAGGSVVMVRCYTDTPSAYFVASTILSAANIQSTVGDKVTVSFSFVPAGPVTEV